MRSWEGPGRGEVAAGLQRVARVAFLPERRCEPRCYTGLDLASDGTSPPNVCAGACHRR